MSELGGDWNHSKQLAKAILSDRRGRRRIMAAILGVVVALMIAGLWLIDYWLSRSPLCFLLWWGACGIFVLMLMVFSLFDALAVVREERDDAR